MKIQTLIFSIVCLIADTVYAENISIVTEDSFPLTYMENGRVVGQATELVEMIMKQTGFEYKLEMLPWARAVHMATNDPNVLIYSIARTPERETQYKWVGEVAPVKYSLYKLRSRTDIVINTLDDARKYRIGVQNGDLRAKFLVQQGFPMNATPGLQEVNNNTLNIKKLENDRVDLIPISKRGLEGLCKDVGFDCSKFEAVFELPIRTNLYMAYSLKTSDEIVERTRKVYSGLRKEGIVRKLMPTYWGEDL